MSLPIETVERVPWREFIEDRLTYRQGDHVTIVGPTGAGKTTLALELLDQRGWVVMLGTKRRDPIYRKLRSEGWRIIDSWPPPPDARRVILRPKIDDRSQIRRQAAVFDAALSDIYSVGGWTVYLDEAVYVSDFLRLQAGLEVLWLQGRTLGVSMMAATQRPAHIPLAAYSQASHLFVWRTADGRDLKRLGEMGGLDPIWVRSVIAGLEGHDVSYIDVIHSRAIVTNVKS